MEGVLKKAALKGVAEIMADGSLSIFVTEHHHHC
jgi:hypothetical protein